MNSYPALYNIVSLSVSGVILFIALQFAFRPIPNELKGRSFYKSCRTMGVSLMIMPIVIFISYIFDLHKLPNHYTTATYICGLYPTASLMHIAFLLLIGENIKFRSLNFGLYLLSYLFLPIYIYNGFKYRSIDTTLSVANTLLFCIIIAQISYLYVKYNAAKRSVEVSKNREIEIHLEWIKKSMCMLLIFATITSITLSFVDYSKWIDIFNMIFALGIFIYIFESYHRFMIKYHTYNIEMINRKNLDIESSKAKEKELPNTSLSATQYKNIETQLTVWLSKKEYLKSGTTIITLAKELSTNRTYISSYINATYGCVFKVWLSGLRIKEAKRLLKGSKNYSVSEVAAKTGFSSQTSFIHVFSKQEGVSPLKWKATNKVASNIS